MATGTANSTPPPPVAEPRHLSGPGTEGYGASVQRQLRRTERQVKFVDLCTAMMMLAAAAFGYLLLLVVIDHWVFGLGFFGRLLALGMLLAGCGWYFFQAILPLLTHRINPLYAARSIEQGTPALKNSLINFLMFRANQSAVHRVVYEAMEQQAATDLANVPVDTAVDRSKMIHVGYLLAAVLAAGAAYTILSPKDPFQTLARVAVPWTAIARPSRVVIEDVQPGSTEAVQGQFIDVTARVRGARDGKDTVSLIYSTHDGQTIERFVPMQLDENGVAYHGQLPADSQGLQHELAYRVASGDAVSETFTITLSPAPTLLVKAIEYDFPRYINRPPETVPRDGNIRGLEGTRVTIVATANKPIRSATITFNPFQPVDAAQPPVKLAMDFQGTTARQAFTLALGDDRRTPLYDSYQLSFVTDTGAASQQPILHQIDVVPDLAPEVEILDPTQNRITIPASGRRKIEVRAVDPDFGLRRMTLRAVSGGTDVLEQILFEHASGRRGQAIATYEFVPSLLGLAAGDKVTYWAVAEDNRSSFDKDHAGGNQAAPNVARTRDYQIEIVADPPRSGKQPGERPGDPSAGEAGQPQPKPSGDGAQPQPMPRDPSSEKPGEKPDGGDNPPPDEPKSEPATSPDESDKEPKKEGTKSQDGAGSGQSGSESDKPDGNAQQGKGGEGAPQDGQPQPGDASSSGGSGGNSPQAGGQPEAASSGQGGDGPPEQLHDGEVFEKVLRKIQEEQAQGKGQPDPNGNGTGESNGDSPPGTNSDQPGRGKPSDKPQGQANDQSKPQGDATGDSQGSDTSSKPFGEDGQPRKNQARPDQAPPKPADSKSGDGARQPDIKRGAGDQKPGNPGEGGDTNDTSGDQSGQQKPDVPGQPDQRAKEPGSGDNGDSGAGQNSEDTTGTGSVESSQHQPVANRDKPKDGNPASTEPQEKSDPGSSNSKKQSDSEGGESGDQSGGGKKGPGQGANQAGNDSAGQNSSADDGAGASSEAGDGESSDAAGGKQEAPGRTGSSGNKKGDGATSRKDPNGNRENEGTAGSSPEAPIGQENRAPQGKPEGGGGGNRQGESGLPAGGGVPSDVRHHAGLDPNMEVSEGDAANLEYSRKTTDMVIDYLKDLESRPNPELLKELGWTPEEMQQFLARWQRLKRGAADDSGRRELDESLRSLGLRSPDSKLRQRRVQSDEQRGLSESGDRSQPPAAYRDLFDAFRKGAARVRDN